MHKVLLIRRKNNFYTDFCRVKFFIKNKGCLN